MLRLHHIFLILFIGLVGCSLGIDRRALAEVNLTAAPSPDQNCPYNCSSHGACDQGQCICFSGWGGKYCQSVLKQLPVGTIADGTVSGPDSWVLFLTQVSKGFNVLDVTVVRTTANQSTGWPQIYARWQKYPNFVDYDFASTSGLLTTRTLQIMMPNPGPWLFGVTADSNCSFIISVALYALCPNDCNGHGRCDNLTGDCDCFPGYDSTEDCSQEILTIIVGQLVSDISSEEQFNYYVVPIREGNQLTVHFSKSPTVSQRPPHTNEWRRFPTATHELFLSASFLPNLTSYDHTAKVNLNNQIELNIPQPKYGNWYIGVWGYSTYKYNLTVFTQTICPNNCNGNGICDLSTGTCHCGAYWHEQDCSTYMREVDMNVGYFSLVESIKTNVWQFYTLHLKNDSYRLLFTFQILSTVPPAMPTVSLYLQRDTVPRIDSYYRFTTCQSSLCLFEIERVSGASFVLGIVVTNPSDTAITFNLSAIADQPCPNNCSNAGRCVNGTCLCNRYYTLSDCSLYEEPLILRMKSYNRIQFGEWKFYSVNITSASYLLFEINTTESFGVDNTARPRENSSLDAWEQQTAGYRLYLQYGTYPTSYSYLRKSTSNQIFQQLLLQGSENIPPGVYYLGVFGHGNAASYWVRAKADRVCPRNCSGNGQCVNDQCVCEPPYIPDDCSNQDLPIAEGIEMSGVVSFERWNYYHISTMSNDALEIIVEEDRENQVPGLLWLFVKRDTRPTIDSSDYRNQSDTTTHSVWISSFKARGNWSIGVTGSPRNHGVLQAKYNILILSGCATYSSCAPCVADPACGWCRNDPEHPKGGICTPGDRSHSFTSKCLVYSFDTCDIAYIQSQSSLQGYIVGSIIGFFMILVLLISGVSIWRRHRFSLQQRMRPANLNLSVPTKTNDSVAVSKQSEKEPAEVSDTKVSGQERQPPRFHYGAIPSSESSLTTGYMSLGNVDVYTDSDEEREGSSSDNGESKSLI